MKTLQASFGQAFGKQQAILDSLTSKLTDMMNNPKGFDPKTLALMKTNASDTVTRQTLAAQTAASASAARGSADLGSGVNAQISGSIAGMGANELASENSNIDIQSGVLQNQNLWNAISGLTGVARAEDPSGLAGAANDAGKTTASLGSAFLASKQADWNNTFGVVKGIAGLGMAAAGLPKFGGGGGGGGGSAPFAGLDDPNFGGPGANSGWGG